MCERISFFGNKTPELVDSLVVVKKSEDIKRFGYGSRYSQQTAYLRSVLGERGAGFNGVWRENW